MKKHNSEDEDLVKRLEKFMEKWNKSNEIWELILSDPITKNTLVIQCEKKELKN